MTTKQYCGKKSKNYNKKSNNLVDRESNLMDDKFKEFYLRDDYETYIVEYIGDVDTTFQNIDYAAIAVTGPTFAIVAVEPGMLARLLDEVPEIIYEENSYPYTLSQLETVKASTYTNFMGNTNSNLKGEGVIVGIISTGIDYLNRHFISDNGKTRIISIWDQTIQDGPSPEIINYGTEFSRESIDRAVQGKEIGIDPYTIVNHRDEVSYGTAIAGIIGGGTIPDDPLVSVVPNCEFAIVKLKEAKTSTLEINGVDKRDTPVYESADIRMALWYLSELQLREKKPVVVYGPFGSNIGGHDGLSPIERYIDYFSQRRGFETVSNTGNEGDANTHTSGVLSNTDDEKFIEINIDENQKNLYISIWMKRPDKISIGITPPLGNPTGKIPGIFSNGEEVRIDMEGSVATIQYFISYVNGDQFVNVLIRNVKSGIWKVNLFGDYIVDGRYDAWLMQRDLLYEETKVMIQDPLVTLTIPTTSMNVLTASYYDSKTLTPSIEAGKGFTRDERIKPEVGVVGTDVLTTGSNGEDIVVSGSAVAGAILCGAVAIIMQWGLVQKNDMNLFTPKIRTYLITSVIKQPGVEYPNPESGYGLLSFEKLFENL